MINQLNKKWFCYNKTYRIIIIFYLVRYSHMITITKKLFIPSFFWFSYAGWVRHGDHRRLLGVVTSMSMSIHAKSFQVQVSERVSGLYGQEAVKWNGATQSSPSMKCTRHPWMRPIGMQSSVPFMGLQSAYILSSIKVTEWTVHDKSKYCV